MDMLYYDWSPISSLLNLNHKTTGTSPFASGDKSSL